MYGRNLAQLMLGTKRDRDGHACAYIYLLLYKQGGMVKRVKRVKDLAKFL